MTEPLDVLIQTALLTRLVPTLASGGNVSDITSPATPVAMPLIAYKPTGAAYLDAHPVMRAAPDSPFVSFDSDVIHKGVFQVDAVVPDNTGEAAGLRLASLVKARFDRGTIMDVGAFRLKILKPPAIADAIHADKAWVRFPVSVAYWLCEG